MPYFKNDNDHHIRVDDGNGNLRRIAPGSVLQATGQFADNLKETSGISNASGEDREKFVESLRGPSADPTPGTELNEGLAATRTAARVSAVAVPLARVVGDDNAPAGPPSGTITSKQTAASKGEKEAFAPKERLPEDAGNEKLQPVQRQQAKNAKAVAEQAAEVYPDAEAPADGGKSSPSKAESGGSKVPAKS